MVRVANSDIFYLVNLFHSILSLFFVFGSSSSVSSDADACVPLTGNEEWVDELEQSGAIVEDAAWHPWFTAETPSMPAGYVTTYKVVGTAQDFSFLTIRLAGHMVGETLSGGGFACLTNLLSQRVQCWSPSPLRLPLLAHPFSCSLV